MANSKKSTSASKKKIAAAAGKKASDVFKKPILKKTSVQTQPLGVFGAFLPFTSCPTTY